MQDPGIVSMNAERNNNQEVLLSVRDVCLEFDKCAVVSSASFELFSGQIGCLLGPSGCGKSTLLRCIAGFEVPTAGTVTMANRIISSQSNVVPPEHRNIGMVFQDFALFPHLTVRQNVVFGIRNQSVSNQTQRANDLLQLVGLTDYADRYPHSLSGGEQQRIALARALAPKPTLLLLDEPFSSLDVELRQKLVPEIRQILQHEKIGALLVTHDQAEAFAMADRVGVMQNGKIHQWDKAYQLYHEPSTRFIADFIGEGEFIRATVTDAWSVESPIGVLSSPVEHGVEIGRHVDVLLRPDDVIHDDDSPVKGKILAKSFRGSHFLYTAEVDSGDGVLCFADSHHNHAIGELIGITFRLDHLVLFVTE